MRQLYETQNDLMRESAVAKELCKQWKCDGKKYSTAHHLDYKLTRGNQLMALCEIKCRNVHSYDYDTYMISYNKIKNARTISREQRVPAFIVVHYEDDIQYFDVEELPNLLSEGGRTDRNDPFDIEEVAHYNMNRLKSIYPSC